ncbi:MAG: hypothetical protein KFKLKKLM_00552 [Flavobacteriales bacterium]|nr:hypothetical protein [Flavobacteriales bacterium]MBV6484069.1 hypothetical protein [Flavobacteriales bacterium]
MKPSTELFQLIKSLSKSEKRYFKLSSSLQSGEKNYLKLFEAIELQNEYNEEAIKEQFKAETFIKHLPSEKNHLYNLILKSLRGFYADNSAASILQEQLRNIELLYNKALYKECSKYIAKAKTIAYNFEKYYFLLDLINWEKKLVEEGYHRGVFEADLNKLVDEETDCIEKLRNIAEYQMLYSQINAVMRKGGYTRNPEEAELVKKISNHPLISEKNTALTLKAATACFSIKAMCYIANGDYNSAFSHLQKVLKIMESNAFIMKELPKRYIKALNSITYAYLNNNDIENCLLYVDKIKALSNQPGFESIDIQLDLFSLPNNAELLAYCYSGEYKKAIEEVIPKTLEGIEKYEGKLSNESVLLLYYNISRVYFSAGEYKLALKYNNIVLNSNEPILRQDVFTFARLVNLIIHFELGNYDLLEYTIKSTKRFVDKNQRNYQFENVFLKNIKKVVRAKNPDDTTKLFYQFKTDLVKVMEDQYELAASRYFDFMTWLDTKIHKKSYADLLKTKKRSLSV